MKGCARSTTINHEAIIFRWDAVVIMGAFTLPLRSLSLKNDQLFYINGLLMFDVCSVGTVHSLEDGWKQIIIIS